MCLLKKKKKTLVCTINSAFRKSAKYLFKSTQSTYKTTSRKTRLLFNAFSEDIAKHSLPIKWVNQSHIYCLTVEIVTTDKSWAFILCNISQCSAISTDERMYNLYNTNVIKWKITNFKFTTPFLPQITKKCKSNTISPVASRREMRLFHIIPISRRLKNRFASMSTTYFSSSLISLVRFAHSYPRYNFTDLFTLLFSRL